MSEEKIRYGVVPMLGILCAVIVGNVAARLGVTQGVGILLVCCGVAWPVAIAILSARKNPSMRIMLMSRRRLWLLPLFAGLAIITGSTAFKTVDTRSLPEGENSVKGEVTAAEKHNGGVMAIVEVREISDSSGRSLNIDSFSISLLCSDHTLRKGDVVEFISELKLIEKDSTNSFYERHNIVARALCPTPESLTVTAHSHSPRQTALKVRDKISDFIATTRLRPSTQSFLQAVLIGDKSRITKWEREKFANAGLAHIMAVSGLHVGIVAGLLLFVTLPLTIVKMRRLRWAVAIGALWGYAFLCGMETPVVRAAIMFTFLIAARGSGRPYMSINALLGAAALIILADPKSVSEVGFQLSFIVTFGIITFPRLWREQIQEIGNPAMRVIIDAMAFSLVAWLSGWMLSAVYFHSAPLLSVPINILILPTLPFVFAVSAVYLLLAAIGFDLHLLAVVTDGLVSIIDGAATWASGVEWSRIFIDIHPLIPGLWYIALLMTGMWVWFRRSAWLRGAAATATATLAAALLL